MMPRFSTTSITRLSTCHSNLQVLAYEAIQYADFTVLCGHRGEIAQEEAYRTKKSTLRWPQSKHNKTPSEAMDIAPWPIDWEDTARFARLFGYIERIAQEKGIKVRWGGDWNNNYRTRDERLIDMPHIEIILE